MGSVAKWAMIIGGIIVALIAVVMVVALTVLKPENYQSVVSDQVRKLTGREFAISGAADLHFFPLGLEATGITFGNAEGFGPAPMVSVKAMDFRIRFMPLLSGEVVVSQIHMNGVDVLLQRNKQGVSNWADLTGARDKADSARSSSNPEAPGAGGAPLAFAVKALTFDDLNLVYDDRSSGVRYELRRGNVDLTDFALENPFDFAVNAQFANGKPAISGDVELEGKAMLDIGQNLYSVSGLKVRAGAAGDIVPGRSIEAELAANGVVLDLKGELLKAEGLEVKAHDVVVDGDLSVTGILSKPTVLAKLNAQPFDLRTLLGRLAIDPPKTADSTALGNVSGSFDLEYGGKVVRLSELTLQVDETAINGTALVSNFSNPAYTARLRVDVLNLDRYLPPRKENAVEGEEGEKKSTSEDAKTAKDGKKEIIPVELLRSLQLDVEAFVGALTVMNMPLSEVRAKIVADKGRLAVDPLFFKGYGGNVNTVLMIDAANGAPRTDFSTEATTLQLGPLLTDLTGKDPLKGKANLRTTLNASGGDLENMKKTLNGTLNFSLLDGVFPGVDVSKLAKQTQKAQKDSGRIEADHQDRTRFGSITGSATVKKGVVRTGDLEVRAPNIRAIGEGDVNLSKKKLSFLVKAKLVPSGKGQGGGSYEDTVGVPIPIRVGGSITNPSYFVNPAEYILMLGTGVVDTVGGVVKGVGGVVEGVGGLLQGLVPGQKKEKPAPQQ